MFTEEDFRLATLLAFAVGIFLVPPLVHIHERAFHVGAGLGVAVIATAILLSNFIIFITRTQSDRFPILFNFTKFFITGTFNTAFDVSIVNLFSFLFFAYAGLPIVIISTISFLIVLVFSYLIHRSWSFKTDKAANTKEFSSFALVSLGSFVINTAILYFLTTISGAPDGVAKALWVNIVKIGTSVISMVLNFLAFRYFVFKENRQISTLSLQQTNDSVPIGSQNK